MLLTCKSIASSDPADSTTLYYSGHIGLSAGCVQAYIRDPYSVLTIFAQGTPDDCTCSRGLSHVARAYGKSEHDPGA